ncbi:MAG: response regulator, partial [Muribaculaceae bacterium]|nr:response regulator [Muribaculaceae bacterium]
ALNEQLAAATQSKLAFFTNVSHDLRTPLTLIAEPVEQLAAAGNLTPQQATLMRIAGKNVRILRRLINQILDFRKYESGKINLHLTEAPFGELVQDWAEAFHAVARKRDIRLDVKVDLPQGFSCATDTGKMERVFFNLMSNAFKYTPDNGHITFSASLADNGARLTFSVADTGKGIAPEDLGRIFDSFFQVEKIHPDGSGIGLALTKAFVELHGGTIEVNSTPGEGSVFTVTIPVEHAAESAPARLPAISAADVASELGAVESKRPDPSGSAPLILVIDDNEDIRHMLGELLRDDYDVIFAPDGQEGVRLAAKYVPDLVICDVMMPVMDGLECCRRIKEETSTSHVPVLLLTACSLDEQRAQGYDSGADGYLAKPFNTGVLKARCRSLVENRKRIRDLWSTAAVPKASAPAAPGGSPAAVDAPAMDMESEFYNRFLALVSQEMGNPELSVDSLAAKMGLGRSQLYRKIKALTNYTPVELLRSLRLRRSRDLLTTTSKTISEIAYEVGFSTPAYFTRCYREAYGETPSDLRERLNPQKR